MWGYICSVRISTDEEMNPVYELDSFLEFSPDIEEKIELANGMAQNELWHVTMDEALKATGLDNLAHEYNALVLRAHANMLTICKFNTDDRFKREWMQSYISSATVVESTRKKIADAKIGF